MKSKSIAMESTTPGQSSQGNGHGKAQPRIGQHGREIQAFDTVTRMPIALDEESCRASVNALNQVLADTMSLRDLYKKHHWQVAGPDLLSTASALRQALRRTDRADRRGRRTHSATGRDQRRDGRRRRRDDEGAPSSEGA